MANMSYCRFENTYKDLLDCSRNLNNVSSDSEERYRERLVELCREIVDEADRGFSDDGIDEDEY